MQEFITTCEQAARAGGKVLLDWRDRFEVRTKAPADLVTQADLASQEAIRKIVLEAFPDHGFLGEEDGDTAGHSIGRVADEQAESSDESRFRWLVDPLDGTTNYVHDLRHYCVSVALARGDELLVGTVYDPIRDECFSAAAGQGAFLNQARLDTSGISRLDDALVAASFSARVPRGSDEVSRFVEMLYRCQALRRMGSAALNLCYVAAGRLDAYWATAVKTWDVAAGILIAREAGAEVSSLEGTHVDLSCPRLAVSATPSLHQEVLEVLALSNY